MPTSTLHKLTSTTAAVIAITAALYLRYHSFTQAQADFQQRGTDDAIDQYAQRMAPLKADLPAEITSVGFLQPEEPGQPVPHSEAWTMTQYVMAPIAVHRNQSHEFVVGDCQSPTQEATAFSTPGLSVIRRYPRGVLLLVRDESANRTAPTAEGSR